VRARLAVLLLLALPACTSSAVRSSPAEALGARIWRLASIEGSEPIQGTEITLELDGERAAGHAGVNRYSGGLVLRGEAPEGGAAEPTPFAATRMYRADPPGVMEQETRYLELLGRVDAWRLERELVMMPGARRSSVREREELVLLAGGRPVLVFRTEP
jgi:heat shock protein HslJ